MFDRKPARSNGNALLGATRDARFQAFVNTLEPAELDPGEVILKAGELCEHVIFPMTGVLSMVAVLDDGARLATALIGNEGFAPTAPLHGVDRTPLQIEVHVPGTFVRVPTPAFRQAAGAFPEMRSRLHLFAHSLFWVAAYGSACDRKHSVDARCARWLLATHDRAPDDEFLLTHDRLAMSIGVRRASVSVAAERLRERGAITYRRGRVRITDRESLLAASCPCYATMRRSAESLARQAPLV